MRKKSAKRAAQRFKDRTYELDAFCQAAENAQFSKLEVTLAFDGALVKLGAAFETLMLECLVCAVNNNTSIVSQTMSVTFPKHLSDAVCEYIVTGGGYFDFRGRSGLIGELKKYLPATHYLVVVVKAQKYVQALDRLVALRNFAAHESSTSKRNAQQALGVTRISAAGAWAKHQNRFYGLSSTLRDLADDLENQAPY